MRQAFEQFDQALERTLEINDKAFRESVERGTAKLAGFEIGMLLVGLGFAVLVYIGLRPRIREYS